MLTINNTLDGYLKDVEILGNTIQDEEDLADIRSVGEKVEGQELYEIPVLSRGKNLFDGELIQGSLMDSTGKPGENLTGVSSANFIRVSNGTISYLWETPCQTLMKIYCYDSNYKYIGAYYYSSASVTSGTGTISIPIETSYIKFRLHGTDNISPKDNIQVQIEEGAVATPYEPYQEDKITILSPVQLEKVGDVADRIICKDGVWGVEKNVKTIYINSYASYGQHDSLKYYWITGNPIGENSEGISDLGKVNIVTNGTIMRFVQSGDMFATMDEFLNRIKLGVNIKYITCTPQFIPLPHSQQVKLRTFANKTNISFLTEIEGTIKAQVPKSLGATVNTHTTQISNLNKELDRVKKLEESTVSTVTTESDFTTVEATSNGYFEDVKLEGKTLVNLADKKQYRDTIEGWKTNLGNIELYKTNTTYTFIGDVTTLADGVNLYIKGTSLKKGHNIVTFTTDDTINGLTIYSVGSPGTFAIDNVVILEGDHTQNPPNGYIEGLKSVGQSATTSEEGADEIVVSSVKGDGNLFDGEIYKDSNKYWFIIRNVKNNSIYIDLGQTCSYFELYECSELSDCYIKYKDWKVIKTVSNQQATITTVNKNHLIIAFDTNFFTSSEKLNKVIVNKGDAITSCKEYQSDKKRLLFYNEETQTWEKPILREWDSIEKHADGKYYYHQRSGEVVLNGSESDTAEMYSISDTTMQFNIRFDKHNLSSRVCINDKFLLKTDFTDTISEGIQMNSSGGGRIVIRILKSKLSTQDVQGFKQWLQTNPVTVVYQLAEEKIYECANIDLITYSGETNYIVECGAIVPKTTLKVHNNISNVVSLLQKKVSLLESNMTKYMITQNRMQLASTYSADSVTFKVDYTLCSEEVEYNEDLYNLILNNILVGKDNYDYDKMFTMILDYSSWNQISWEQFDILVGVMDMQHNPPVEDEVIEEKPNEIM